MTVGNAKRVNGKWSFRKKGTGFPENEVDLYYIGGSR